MNNFYPNMQPYEIDRDHPYFDGIPIPSNFVIDFSPESSSIFYVVYTGIYKEFGPRMVVEADIEDGIVYFNPIIGMPSCSSDELEYADSFEFLADRYAEAARIATYLIKNPLVLDEWGDEEDY